MLLVSLIPALKDNYIYCLEDSGKVAIVDPSESQPVFQFLSQRNLPLHFLLNTHHHWDHTDGNLELKKQYGCEIFGFEGDRHRIPGITRGLHDGESFLFGNTEFRVVHVPGHTLGAIAYVSDNALFSGDTLFSLGCGRLFEGTAEQMFLSLSKLKTLADSTLLYAGHEYTEKNLKFTLERDPKNPFLLEKQRKLKIPSLPSALGEEKKLNLFLKADSAEAFAAIRRERDRF